MWDLSEEIGMFLDSGRLNVASLTPPRLRTLWSLCHALSHTIMRKHHQACSLSLLTSSSTLNLERSLTPSLCPSSMPHWLKNSLLTRNSWLRVGWCCLASLTWVSKLQFYKSKNRARMNDEHLSAILRISISKIAPDFDKLVKQGEQLHYSNWQAMGW